MLKFNFKMNNSIVKISSNWTQIGGCPFSQSFQLHTADPDSFKRPDLDDIVDEGKSILLSKLDFSDYCELLIRICPDYKIQSLSLVCNVDKVEIFFGPIKEYLETVYGVSLEELDDQFKTYRYDVEIEKSGVTDLTLKFLTHSNDVCIFGIILYIAPNPNGITTLLQASDCNSDLKTNSAQYSSKEQLRELIKNSNIFSSSSNTTAVDQLNKMNISEENVLTDRIQLFIDERLKKLEERLQCRLEKMEEIQMRKLDDILNKLEKLK